MSVQDKNQVIILHSKHFAMLDQSKKNDRFLLDDHFTADVAIIIIEDYKKFHDKMNKSSSTKNEFKKLILENYHDWIDCWDFRKIDKLSSLQSSDHRIDLQSEVTSSVKKTYNMSRDQIEVVKRYINDMMSKEFIRRSHFDYAASILVVKKSKKNLRVCVNYRALNALTIKNRNASSLIRDILTRLYFVKIYIKFDVIAAFNEIRMQKNNQEKTVFITRYDLFEYVIMPFELYNAFETFQSFINETLRKYFDDFCTTYLNDILIYSDNYEQHQIHVHKILIKLRVAHLYLDIKKCQFNVTQVRYLSLVITIKKIKMNSNKVRVIQKWETSRYLKNVQIFLSFVNFYRRFVREYSRLVKSLSTLIKFDKKNIVFLWVSESEKVITFKTLKKVFIAESILLHFDFFKKIWIETNVFDYVVVAMLSQIDFNDLLHSIAYMFKQMSSAKYNYEIYDKKLLIIVRVFEE